MVSHRIQRGVTAGRWRVLAAVSMLAFVSACAERAYLADEGWRADVPGLSKGQSAAFGPVPADSDDKAPVEEAADGAVVSLSPSGYCTIESLAAGTADAIPAAGELRAAYACLQGAIHTALRSSGHVLARQFSEWTRVTATPFLSEQIGGRYGVVYANARALDQAGQVNHFDRGFAVGSTLAVSTFEVGDGGRVEQGPVIFVEKMEPGFFALQGNWRYSVIDPDGGIVAVTRGINAEDVAICADCTHSQADLLYASLLNDGVAPYAEGDGPAFPSVDTYGSSGGLVPPPQQLDGTGGPAPSLGGDGVLLDPNAPIFDPNAPLDPDAPILDPNAPITDG